jgi:hypothetical protein
MPAPNHNFVLANGIITHNSHTVSYGVISYWCAWMKVYHPMEYAASCLRHAKDDEQALELLREMSLEGVSYTPFDIEASAVNWAAVDGRLVGGFTNLVGVGPAKATAAINARNAGKLTQAMRDKFAALPLKFRELFPLSKDYAALYADPEAHGCRVGSVVSRIDTMPLEGEVLIICKVQRKEQRDENETIRAARRDGRRLTGPTIFLDVFVTDDSGVPITLRFDRHKYEPAGRVAAELLEAGDALLVRGKRIPNFAMVNVTNIKCLNREIKFYA